MKHKYDNIGENDENKYLNNRPILIIKIQNNENINEIFNNVKTIV